MCCSVFTYVGPRVHTTRRRTGKTRVHAPARTRTKQGGCPLPGYSIREASPLGNWPRRAGAAHADKAHDGQAIGGASEALHDAPRAVHQPAAGVDVARQHHLRAFAQLQAPRRLRAPARPRASLLVTAGKFPRARKCERPSFVSSVLHIWGSGLQCMLASVHKSLVGTTQL